MDKRHRILFSGKMKKIFSVGVSACFVAAVQAVCLIAISTGTATAGVKPLLVPSAIAQPTVNRLSPPAGAPGTEVTIIGSGFNANTTVSMGGEVISVTLKPNDRSLVVKVPVLNPGNVAIIVNNPSAIVASATFTVLPALVFNQATAPQIEAGEPLSVQLSATGGKPAYVFSNTTPLPPGLSISSGGLISGTPTQAGTYTTSLLVTDANHLSVGSSISFVITPGPSITAQTLPVVIQNHNFSYSLTAAGGQPPYSWSIAKGAIPGGLLLTSAGMLEGDPALAGNYSIDIKLTDAIGASVTNVFTFVVKAPPPPPQSVVLLSRGGRFALYNSSTAIPAVVQATGHLPGITAGIAKIAGSSGYFAVNSVGRITCINTSGCFRSLPRKRLSGKIVALASNTSLSGYWLLSNKGFIYRGGHAKIYDSFSTNLAIGKKNKFLSFRAEIKHQHLAGIATSPHGLGYWVISSKGTLWGFGTARKLIPLTLQKIVRLAHSHVVSITSAEVGIGFYVTLANGDILPFGSAVNYGSPKNVDEAVGMVIAPGAKGYWLITRKGQIISFGNAANLTFAGGIQLNNGVIGGIAER